MYIVQEGRVKVSRLLPNGKEMILAFHEAREYFGEMSLIDGGTSPATVTTVIPSRVLTVTRANFLELLEQHSINRAVLKMLCEPPRDFRRLHFLRGWGHGKTKQILTRG